MLSVKSSIVDAEEGGELLRVPLNELKIVVQATRSLLEENHELAQELARSEEEAKVLELKLAKRQHQLERCDTIRPGHGAQRPLHLGGGRTRNPHDVSVPKLFRSKSELFGSSIRHLVGEQAEKLNQLSERDEHLRALMDATRDISQASTSMGVVGCALRAAQQVLPAEKYTLGILNEKKDRVDLFSSPPVELPGGKGYVEDGSVLVDSATTFGRVVLTGKELEVIDVNGSEIFDVFEEQLELLEFEPEALFCAPIFNVYGVLVGVFQAVTRKQLSGFNSRVSAVPLLASSILHQQRGAFSAHEKESVSYICMAAGTALWNLSLARAHQAMQSRIECLLKLNRSISIELNASAVLQQIITVSYELLRAEHIALYVRDEGTDEFYLFVNERQSVPDASPTAKGGKIKSKATRESQHSRVGHHRHGAGLDDAFLRSHNGIAGLVMRTGQLVLTNSASSHPAFDPRFDDPTGSFRTKQVLCAPVKDADAQVLAVVCATNKVGGDEFTADDALYLNYAAEAAGISLHKSNLLRAVVASQRLTEARLRLTDFVTSSGETSDDSSRGLESEDGETGSAAALVARFVSVVMAEGKKLLCCDRFGFLLVDPLKQELWITQEGGRSVCMPLTKGLSGLVASSGKPVCTRDAYTHPHFDPTLDRSTGYRTKSVLGMPVFEDHTPTNPKIVAVAMAINKRDDDGHDGEERSTTNRGGVPFTANDSVNMARYCREIQFALGRLSLDISYYKVISDCGLEASASDEDADVDADADADLDTGGDNGDLGLGQQPGAVQTRNKTTPLEDDVNESEIIASIVHKYCQATELDVLEAMATVAFADDPDDEEENSKDISETPDGDADMGEAETSNEDATPATSDTVASRRVSPRRSPALRESSHVLGVGDVTRWDFNCLDLSNSDMFAATAVLFRSLGLLERFQVAAETFSSFLSHVASHYRANAYHNFQHAFQVTHATFCLLRRSGVTQGGYFARVELFAMLIAALCHDLDHPGNNNDFEIKARSQLALTHNDDAVLERHHCRVAFIILSHPSANLLARLPTRACFMYVRRLLIHCILSTDMAKHFDKCKALEGLSRRHLFRTFSGSHGDKKRSRNNQRLTFMGILLHAADLSGQSLPFAQAARWGMRILSEFQEQAKSEAEMCVPVESFMTNLHQTKTRVTVQLNFLSYVLRPIWMPLAALCPELRIYADTLESNRERYKVELERLQSEEEALSSVQSESQSESTIADAQNHHARLGLDASPTKDTQQRS